MTRSSTPYFHWGTSGINSLKSPYESCSPNLIELYVFMNHNFGAQTLGCHNQRDIRGGGSLSTHAYGAALDVRFPNRGILLAVCAWLVNNSAELGVNAIHDYASQKMWTPGQDDDVINWPHGNIGSVGGDWIHVEVTPGAFLDGRSVAAKLTGAPPPPPPPPPPELPVYDPLHHKYSLWPLNPNKPSLVLGSGYAPNTQQYQGAVTYLNHVLIVETAHVLPEPLFVVLQPTIDACRDLRSFFDPKGANTAWAVEAWNGVIGPETWKCIDYLAGRPH